MANEKQVDVAIPSMLNGRESMCIICNKWHGTHLSTRLLSAGLGEELVRMIVTKAMCNIVDIFNELI